MKRKRKKESKRWSCDRHDNHRSIQTNDCVSLSQGDEIVEDHGSKPSRSKRAREEFTPAEDGAEGPMGSDRAFLKPRQGPIDLDSKVGKTEVINPTTVEGSTSAGFWCEVCSCLLKDSTSYLDHINGKKRKQ